MSGVFLSYSRGDRALAERVLKGLRGLGVDVWWDEDMPGVDWQEELARQINELAAVVVVWTPLSANSKNVRDEARLGQHTEKLVNALAGVASPPFPFDRTNGLPLDTWTGREPHSGWTRLVATVEDHLVAAGALARGELTRKLAQREADIRRLKQALVDAEEAFQAAKADEAAASAAAAEAEAQLAACDDQMRRVAEIARGPSLLRAAQADLDAAMVAQAGAETTRKAAAAALSSAARAFSRARTALERMFDDVPPAPPPSTQPEPAVSAPAEPGLPPPALAGPAPPPPPARLSPEATPRTGVLTSPPPRRPPPTSRPVGANTPLIAAVVAAVVVLGVVLAVAGMWKRGVDTAAAGDANGATPPANAAVAAANTAAAPAALTPASLAGQWQGEGATCAAPLVIGISGQTLSLTMMGQTTTGAIQATDAGAFKVKWPDGVWSYEITGETLKMTPPKGRSFGYVRCAG